ncbi:Predicted metalloprotease [Raoultella ornithinolytica]|nr:Predicted metalloprotease [Raoultella ornithinolytica]
MLTGEPVSQQQTTTQRSISPQEEQAAKFTKVILADTEDTWGAIFQKMGRQYPQPKLVLYRGATRTGCGTGQSVMGPFYCPADSTVYIDLSFYDEMKNKLGADGDFAQAYVIAHEVGHHVQKLLGIESKVRQLQQHASQAEANRLSVKMELQADCFAGVVGSQHAGSGCYGNRRSAGSAECRRGHRRRSPATAKPGTCGPGQLYPRYFAAALYLV